MSKGGVSQLLRVFATVAAAGLGGSFAIGFVTSSVSEQITLRRKVETTGMERYSNYLFPLELSLKGFPFYIRTGIKISGVFDMLLFPSYQKKYGRPCGSCKGVGFYTCKLCKTNGTIKWSPLYDPLVINPCVCPTCDGFKVQRCLNCLGGGIQG